MSCIGNNPGCPCHDGLLCHYEGENPWPVDVSPLCGNGAAESETVMGKEMKIGMHVVFIDAHRKEQDALVTAIHGDSQGRRVISSRKSAAELTQDEKASGKWQTDSHDPPIYAYEVDDKGVMVVSYDESGEHWPCINLVIVSENEAAQDQYGRQIDERHTSVVHWTDSTAIGYCFRFSDEEVDKSRMQSTIS